VRRGPQFCNLVIAARDVRFAGSKVPRSRVPKPNGVLRRSCADKQAMCLPTTQERGRRKGNPARGLEGGIVTRELALRPERWPMPVKPPKAPQARTRSGAEANSVHLWGQRVEGTPKPPPTPMPGCKMLQAFRVTPGAIDIGLSASTSSFLRANANLPQVSRAKCEVSRAKCETVRTRVYLQKRRAFALNRHNSGYGGKRGPRGRIPSVSFLPSAGPA
jgi:hypothetical protein